MKTQLELWCDYCQQEIIGEPIRSTEIDAACCSGECLGEILDATRANGPEGASQLGYWGNERGEEVNQ
jgi:hypothetical protein